LFHLVRESESSSNDEEINFQRVDALGLGNANVPSEKGDALRSLDVTRTTSNQLEPNTKAKKSYENEWKICE
jgi:hypothetical protein